MTQQPITPPPDELVATWCRETDDNEPMFPQVAAKAAQWGADQMAKRDALTDEQLVHLANRAGLCYPACWALDDIADADPERMGHLREFARLILEAHGPQ